MFEFYQLFYVNLTFFSYFFDIYSCNQEIWKILNLSVVFDVRQRSFGKHMIL